MASSAAEILANSAPFDEWPNNGMAETPQEFETRFHRLADGDMFTDCEFIVGPERTVVKGHKVFFCVVSEVFQAMFFGHLKETKAVYVEDLELDGFKGMKTYIYTGEVDFKSAFHALSTFIAARKYLIVNLTRECVKYVKEALKPAQVLEFRDCCKLNGISVFDDLCSKIIEENTEEVVGSEYFLSANSDTIELMLKSRSLKLNSEIEVFGHFERWALAEIERREIPAKDIATSFDSLKKHIRFLTISGDEFVARVEPSPLLTREEKYAIAMNKIKFNPRLTSENISMARKSRRLGMSQSDSLHEQKHVFQIPIFNKYGSRTSSGINLLSRINQTSNNYSCYDEVSIYWTSFNQSICFEANITFYSSTKLVVIKSKFRVLAQNECNDLFFIKEGECIMNNTSHNTFSSQKQRNNLVLAVIPKSSLKTEHYSRDSSRNVIRIEGSFTVEQINL